MSENNNTDSPKSTPTKSYDNNEETNLNVNVTEAADMAEQGTYDNMQSVMVDEKIQQNKQALKNLDEEAEKKEKKDTKVMLMKNPDFSLGWTIGDTRCYMFTLQMIVAGLCGLLLITSYSQMTLGKCNENKYNRPYDSDTEKCSWPTSNVILRCIGPVIGLIFALITIILSYCKGSVILRDMAVNNDKRDLVKKLEYFDIYNQFCIFKFMRYVLGYCGYLQFISVGFDAYSFLSGNEYATKVLNVPNNTLQFQMIIGMSLLVGILLRISHDSMYQRVYKHKLSLDCGFQSDKGYAGATVVDKGNKDQIIQMGDTHHLNATQADIQLSMQAQQRQYLQNQNNILASNAGSVVNGSVYGDAQSVYSHHSGINGMNGLNHYNTQTMHSLTQQNLACAQQQHLAHLHHQNMSAPAFNVTSQASQAPQYQ